MVDEPSDGIPKPPVLNSVKTTSSACEDFIFGVGLLYLALLETIQRSHLLAARERTGHSVIYPYIVKVKYAFYSLISMKILTTSTSPFSKPLKNAQKRILVSRYDVKLPFVGHL
jgi:hypothetical protein